MAFYRCGGGGIPSSLKTDMNAVLNKKFGTFADYPPADWAPTVNLMGPLPEKTIVSSPIADFNDGADDVPTKSLVVTIPPTLSGVSSVTETQAGRNFYPIQIGADRFVNNGSATHSDDNGTLVIVTSTGSASGVYINIADTSCEVRNVLKWCYDRNISKTISFDVVSSVDNVSMRVTSGTNTLFTVGTTKTRVSHVSTSNNFSVYTVNTPATLHIRNFQIELGSTAHAYEPYQTPTQYTASLGRTIYGGQVDIVNGEEIAQFAYHKITADDDINLYPSADGFRLPTASWASGAMISQANSGGLCNILATVTASTSQGIRFGINNDQIYMVQCYDLFGNTVKDFKTYVTNNDVYVIYRLATPTDFTFDGQEVPTRLGYNAFWSDEGDTEVTYRADINLALGGQ